MGKKTFPLILQTGQEKNGMSHEIQGKIEPAKLQIYLTSVQGFRKKRVSRYTCGVTKGSLNSDFRAKRPTDTMRLKIAQLDVKLQFQLSESAGIKV